MLEPLCAARLSLRPRLPHPNRLLPSPGWILDREEQLARLFAIDTDNDYRQRWQAHGQRKNAADRPDGWLGELTLPPERKADESRADASRTGRRASDLGILPVLLDDYTRLLTWTAKQLRGGQRDTIPADLATVLDHFDVQHDSWLDTVDKYETAFGHAVGARLPGRRGGAHGVAAPEGHLRLPRRLHLIETFSAR